MNPALPSGVDDGAGQLGRVGYGARATLTSGWIPYPERRAGGEPVPDPAGPRLDVFLTTLSAGLGRPDGPDVSLQLPIGVIARSDTVSATQRDAGVGDLEVRGRYGAGSGALRGGFTLGLALPTGAYATRSGEGAVSDGAGYLTLGRGVWAALVEADASAPLGGPVSAYGGAAARLPVGDARDGYRWGAEVRGWAGLRARAFEGRVTASLSVEAQHRAPSSLLDPFAGRRVTDANTGGLYWTASPGVRVQLGGPWSAFVAGRIPVGTRGEGLQFVPAPGAFVGLSWSLGLGSAAGGAPAMTPELAPGRVTLVDYWASWCGPCVKLEPAIEAARARYPGLAVRKVDASSWSPGELEAALPGVAGLPVVEVYRRDGTRAARLVGEEAFGFERVLEEVAR